MNRYGKQAKLDYLDWLNVLAMLTIFFFHCARFFNHEDWHVKNSQLSEGLSLFVVVVSQWIMPLFFMLSGISSYYSLSTRKWPQYIWNRLLRLVVPFIFGIFAFLIPLQVWIERISHAQFDGSFIEFYPHYFEGLYAFGGNFAWMGLHLWYLEMLFVFTLLTLPLFVFFKMERFRKQISEISMFFAKNGAVFLLSIPLFLMELVVNLQPDGVGMRAFGGWSPFSYLVIFVIGFFIAFNPICSEAFENSRYIALILCLMISSLMIFNVIDLAILGKFSYPVTIFARAFNSWCWLVSIFGFGAKHLNFNSEIKIYAREATLPFYIIHQTVIVIIGFYIVNWGISIVLKYLLLSTFSFIIITFIYELFVKRIGALRFLFGMKSSR
ncbi:MAG: acyltransferase family protein [Desulfamplus sp.]|nr:acyltransferase family protein [Desulfamplus sp.]